MVAHLPILNTRSHMPHRSFARVSRPVGPATISSTALTLDDFDYDLPPKLIAQAPLPDRSAGRLLTLDPSGPLDRRFRELPSLLRAGDLLVFNDTRVIHARLNGVRGSGGKVEVLIERQTGPHEALAQVRASHSPKPGSTLLLDGVLTVEVLGREGEFFLLRFPGGEDLVALLERHGKVPLPPYIERAATADDHARYQTVFAREPGSVAAPTAGLHFDEPLLADLAAQGVNFAYVTLHVGAGTFQPVRVQNLAEHRMHRERYWIPEATVAAIVAARERGGRVIAVGTTSLRALEAAALEGELGAGEGETDLFILPGFDFRIVDGLVTNFHLPRSTLLMLVSAFAGVEEIRSAYAHAVAQAYRFFSYGDAMFINRKA
jgi:S-adenosylmethionine:tRNA ribosyltransferase-isomerase